MIDPIDRELRLECARIAGGDVDRAKVLYEFVTSNSVSVADKELASLLLAIIRSVDDLRRVAGV